MIKTLNIVYFSPTKTTQKIFRQVATGTGIKKINEFDVTTKSNLDKIVFSENELTIIGAPVYSGRIPTICVERFKQFKGSSSPAILTVLYGNRAYEDALLELKDLTEFLGFKIIAAGAFIGEHSFSLNEYEIAKNRPDNKDIEKAKSFGDQVVNKLRTKSLYSDLIEIPGNFPYRIKNNQPPEVAPATDLDRCIKCKECIGVCPTHSICLNGDIQTELLSCIWCCACIKFCKQNARIINYNRIINIQKWLVENYSERCEPEIFL